MANIRDQLALACRRALQAPAPLRSCVAPRRPPSQCEQSRGSSHARIPRLSEPRRPSIHRRWRWASIGIYGSLLAGLIAYIAFSPNRDANYAAASAPVSVNR